MLHTEVVTGFEASDNYANGYVGGDYAFGKGLYARGLRLRAVGAFWGTMTEPCLTGATQPRRLSTAKWVSLLHCWAINSAPGHHSQTIRRGWGGISRRATLGLEGGALGNEEYDVGRGGGFVRVRVQSLDITLSGGFTGDYLMEDPSGYVSLGVYRAF
jgi:hypothetical protein